MKKNLKKEKKLKKMLYQWEFAMHTGVDPRGYSEKEQLIILSRVIERKSDIIGLCLEAVGLKKTLPYDHGLKHENKTSQNSI